MNKTLTVPAPSKLNLLRQICNFIPEFLVARIARETKAAEKARTFSPWSHVVALVYAQLIVGEPIRELRNHIAHGTIRLGLTSYAKTWEVTLSLPRDLDGTNSPEARHVTFEELDKAREELGKLIEEFEQLDGKWIVDADIRF